MAQFNDVVEFLNGDGSFSSSLTRAVGGVMTIVGLYGLHGAVPESYEAFENGIAYASSVPIAYSIYQGARAYFDALQD